MLADECNAVRKFENGQQLPSAEKLIATLNLLGAAQDSGNHDDAAKTAQQIREMVTPGIYQGYLEDVGLEIKIIRVLDVKRRDKDANIHTFYIEYEEVQDKKDIGFVVTSALKRIDLRDFLRETTRTLPRGGGYQGWRFWPYKK